jgi:hypothetical protein
MGGAEDTEENLRTEDGEWRNGNKVLNELFTSQEIIDAHFQVQGSGYQDMLSS